MVQSDHGLALVLEEGETGLSKMAGRDGRNRKKIHAVFDGRDGADKPMRYTIKTVAYGAEADHIRNSIARHGLAEMQTQYVNYYARRYPEIKVKEALRHFDDLNLNQFTIIESYEILDFWKRPEPSKRRQGYVRSSEIRTRLATPDDLNRKSPLATRYPEDIEEVTEVKLTGDWEVQLKDVIVQDPAFEFSHKVERGEGDVKYLLTDRLRWLKSQVEPDEVRDYAAKLKKAYGEVGMSLNLADSRSSATTSPGAPKVPSVGRTEDERRRATSWRQLIELGVLLAFWSILAIICWRSPKTHRSQNWFLMGQVVWISTLLWVLASVFPNSWKTQTLGLIVLFFGSIALKSRVELAPETHWQHAHVNPEALAGKRAGMRYLIRGINAVPTIAMFIGIGYYVKALLT